MKRKDLSPAIRTLQARVASQTSWANTEDRTKRTAPGTRAMLQTFERQVDPKGELSPAERAKRAEAARKAHFSRLALASAQARNKRKRDAEAAAERARPTTTNRSVVETQSAHEKEDPDANPAA